MYDLKKLMKGSEPIADYLASIGPDNAVFAKGPKDYRPIGKVVNELKRYAKRVMVIVFSAEWCPDCARNVPALGRIAEVTGIEVRVFGHLMRSSLSSAERWKCSPSPPECREFNVVKIPLIIVIDGRGEKLGEIVENPPVGERLEETLLKILKGSVI